MTTINKLIIISDKLSFAQGLTQLRNHKLNLLNFVEDDCACPTPPNERNYCVSLNPKDLSLTERDTYIVPPLYIDNLYQDFYLAFNATEQTGVIAFNHPILSLLKTFQQPRTLKDGLVHAGLPLKDIDKTWELVNLGLLQATNASPTPQMTSTRTLTAWLHVTNNCNLRCPYCYVNKTPDPMEVEVGQKAVEAVFRSAVAQDFRQVKLKYAGGEATLNFQLVLHLHKYAQNLAEEYGLHLDGVILSNGVALTSRMIEELKKYNIRLMISLDGVGEHHDRQRSFVNGRGSFSQVERTLDRLATHNFIPSISITISNRNLMGLPEVVAYVLKRELPFTLNFYRENECSTSFSDLAYKDEQVIAAMKKAFAVIEANLPPYSLLGTLVDRARLDVLHDRPCGVGHSYMVINQNGGIGKCHMEMEQIITDITAINPLQQIQQDQIGLQNPSVEEKEGCKACTWRYWCAGGCPVLTYRMTGRFDVKSPNCRIYKALFPEVLRLEGLRLLKLNGFSTS